MTDAEPTIDRAFPCAALRDGDVEAPASGGGR